MDPSDTLRKVGTFFQKDVLMHQIQYRGIKREPNILKYS